MNTVFKNKLALVALATALLSAPVTRAQFLNFNVDLNTAALGAQNSANAPFYLDFQLNYGGSTNPATTVTLSNFQFTGGSAMGSATTLGTASGSMGSTLTLSASSSSQLNELYQQFSTGTTDISFTAHVSGAGFDVTPTSLSVAIMDNSLGSPAQIFTSAPDTESMVFVNIDPTKTASDVQAYMSVSSADGNTPLSGVVASVTPVPEPSTYAAIMGGAAVGVAFLRRRLGKAQLVQAA